MYYEYDEYSEPKTSKKVKKKFCIEYRISPHYKDPPALAGILKVFFSKDREWHIWRRYKTQKSMEDALRVLRNCPWRKKGGY